MTKSGGRVDAEDLAAVVRAVGIRDPGLLAAIRDVPRAEFVPPALAARAYLDEPLPIGHGQVTTQPSLAARMVEALELGGREHVLEIGTGFGWQTALLARLAAFVWSVERWPDLAEEARARLARHGVDNAEVTSGDGTQGLTARAPFDAIIVCAAFTSVPEALAAQLADGGRLVQPLGPGGAEEVVRFRKVGARLKRGRTLTRASFVRLCGRHGFES